MADKITIAIEGNIRIYVASTKDSILEAVKKHNLWPVATQVLGRVMSITAIMGSQLKDKQKTVSILNGGGPLGTIMSESDAHGNIRGYVANPSVDLRYGKDSSLTVSGAIGKKGYLKIIKDLQLKEPFTAQVSMVDGEVTQEFINYFYKSEQTKTALLIGLILDKEKIIISSGAMFFQLLPNHTEEDILRIEKAIVDISSISKQLVNKTPEEIIKYFMPNSKILETKNIKFNCFCDIEKMQNAIRTLGKKDIEVLMKEGQCEIKCQFCSKIKVFNKKELEKLI